MEYFKLDTTGKLINCNNEDPQLEFVRFHDFHQLQNKYWNVKSLLNLFKRDMTRWVKDVETQFKDL